MNDQNIIFDYPPPPPYKKTRNIEKGKNNNFDECSIFFIGPFLLREYNLFSQNTEISLEQ